MNEQPLVNTNKRLLSLDILRGVTMLLMIFINDLAGVKNMPYWMEHAKKIEDRLGFADTIFPLFLFIVGLSIPLAIGKKIKQGDSFKTIGWHIITRSFALLVMGFFHVNMENYNPDALLPEPVFEILATTSFFLIWLDYPKNMSKLYQDILRWTGASILVLLAFLFLGGTPAKPVGLRTYWWGILGIIGWSYLVCAGLYLIFKGKRICMIIAFAVLMLTNVFLHYIHIKGGLPIIKDCSSASLTMAGVVIALWYADIRQKAGNTQQWWLLTLTGIVSILAGLFARNYTEGISKIRSTPSWVLICIGIGILSFQLAIYLIDIKGKEKWFSIIKPAGTSTLTSYLLPYFLYSFMAVVHFKYPQFLSTGVGGFFRSVAIAFFIVIITGLLEKRHIRLKI